MYVWDKKGLGGARTVLLFLEIIVEVDSRKLITQHDSRDGLTRSGQRSGYQRYSWRSLQMHECMEGAVC